MSSFLSQTRRLRQPMPWKSSYMQLIYFDNSVKTLYSYPLPALTGSERIPTSLYKWFDSTVGYITREVNYFMKYEAVNDWVIVKRDLTSKKTESGIILTKDESDNLDNFKLEVVHTTEPYKELIGKNIRAVRADVRQFNQGDQVIYGALKAEKIMCIEHD